MSDDIFTRLMAPLDPPMTDIAILAWHFVKNKLRDGSPIPPDGEWLHYKGKCVMCHSGLHASRRLIDALEYTPENTICRVACSGIAEEHSDKLVSTHRFILWRLDGEKVLREFARQQALSVIHLWNAPQVVKDYLTIGDESLRSASRSAAESAAWSAAWSVAESAARSAAGGAAWNVAGRAAGSASGSASRTAVGAARSAAWSVADTTLTQMVLEARGNPDDESLLKKVPAHDR